MTLQRRPVQEICLYKEGIQASPKANVLLRNKCHGAVAPSADVTKVRSARLLTEELAMHVPIIYQ